LEKLGNVPSVPESSMTSRDYKPDREVRVGATEVANPYGKTSKQ